MASGKAFFFTGTKDTVVNPGVVAKAEDYATKFGTPYQKEDTIAAEHSWVTLDYGSACTYKGEPYINKCSYDLSGTMYNYFYGTLNAKGTQVAANMLTFDQSLYTPTGKTPASISLASTGYVYVPTACQQGQACKLTLVFHGCLQTTADIGDKFYKNVGVNEWAETNNIIVVYPQAVKSAMLSNPNGCFDWWGYTDSLMTDTYSVKTGAQMSTMRNMITAITGF
eukprot:TRINITY_DN1172_c0_g1_i4.p1 TRINITY_DN1172_c0_g1~~TRINITY_DN1172_c0_g1_i4.p1  ORF type:complete len:243 (-),score=81.57 TRINITY_DN1172_c0_g1_i4:57-728(-)